MSEAKWWPKGKTPTEPGYYISTRIGERGQAAWKFPEDRVPDPEFPSRVYYGPIPEPPKEPPKLRRFRAMLNFGGVLLPVSGVEVAVNGGKEIYYFKERTTHEPRVGVNDLVFHGTAFENELVNPQWLDKE